MGKVGMMGKVGKTASVRQLHPINPIRRSRGLASRAMNNRELLAGASPAAFNRISHIPSTPASTFMLQVSGRIDQDQQKWVEILRDEKRCLLPLDAFSTALQEVVKKLNAAEILIVTDQAKNYLKSQVQGITEWKDIYIAGQRGWHNKGKVFVLAHDFVVGESADLQELEILLDDDSNKWTSRGTHAEWLETAKLMVGQSRIVFLVSFQFVPPVLSMLSDFFNVGIELVAAPGFGKTTVARYALSVWGGDPTRLTGFSETWATTLAGLEPTIQSHSYAMLGLDELSLFGSLDDRQVRRQLETAVFRLCYGVEKAKYGASGRPRADRVCWQSTSNVPILDVLTGIDPNVVAAVGDRLITIPSVASEFGIFDRLPPGFVSSSALAEYIHSASDKFYGVPIRIFLTRLVRTRRCNEPALCAWIEATIQIFLRRAGVDPNNGPAVRVARQFGLIYAVGCLAQRWSVLPLEWRIGWAVLLCYRAHLSHRTNRQTSRRTELDRIIDYARQHRQQLVDLRAGKVDMDDASFAEAYGFLKATSGGGIELLVPPPRMHRSFPDYLPLMQELHRSCPSIRRSGETGTWRRW
jgi:Domain of unknown function (DUF927)